MTDPTPEVDETVALLTDVRVVLREHGHDPRPVALLRAVADLVDSADPWPALDPWAVPET